MPPVDGDLVYIPKGLVLLIDTDVPKVAGIFSDSGGIIIDDTKDLTLKPTFIFVIGGFFKIGSEDAPYTHNLVI